MQRENNESLKYSFSLVGILVSLDSIQGKQKKNHYKKK